jgi:glycosyltransferase involved in cell wall biosynthesis
MPDALYIDPCNFEDFPMGGKLSFAKQMVHTYGARLALVGISTDETPIGRWVKRALDGGVCDFFSIGRWSKSPRKPIVPMRIHTYCGLMRYREQILSVHTRAVFTCAAEVLLATRKWGWEDVCFYFPGLDSPLRMPRYRWAKALRGIFDSCFLSVLQSVNLVLAAADEPAIKEFVRQSGGRIQKESIIPFPSRADTSIFYPTDQVQARERLGVAHDVPVFVSVGRLHYRKGWELLIDAFRLLLTWRTNAHLYLIGDGADRGKVERKVQEYALSERVHLTGYLDSRQIAAYLNAADVFVLSSFFEGWPTAMVEALATGKAIVSTPVGAAAELIENAKNGYIVDSRDAQEFAKAMVEALSLDARASSLDKARPYVLAGLAQDLGRIWAPLQPRE